jgi:hypothetical protein
MRVEKREKEHDSYGGRKNFVSWDSLNVRKEVRLLQKEKINPAYKTKQLTIRSP